MKTSNILAIMTLLTAILILVFFSTPIFSPLTGKVLRYNKDTFKQPNFLGCEGNFLVNYDNQWRVTNYIRFCNNGCSDGACISKKNDITGKVIDNIERPAQQNRYRICDGAFIYLVDRSTNQKSYLDYCWKGCIQGKCL